MPPSPVGEAHPSIPTIISRRLIVIDTRFPKQSKGSLSDTLTAIADRVGDRLGDKRWVIKTEFQTRGK